eukprot:CAMPEP_0197515146 /NCGR_PEP_ID=MMETSP1318-20131121/359_1 /TAXON_ID=552666 /ORGANISM="Partenskyella glossopodia, Strain RCC365" /LENGTH=144 /DNA_ID=CAMNT_0043063429 /DNA_START=6 /DNA_END=440 /DNA_ORIENTATION=+
MASYLLRKCARAKPSVRFGRMAVCRHRLVVQTRVFSVSSDVETLFSIKDRSKQWKKTMKEMKKEDPMDIDDIVAAKITEITEMQAAGESPAVIEAYIEKFESELEESPTVSPMTFALAAGLGMLTVYSVLMVKGILDEKKQRRK